MPVKAPPDIKIHRNLPVVVLYNELSVALKHRFETHSSGVGSDSSLFRGPVIAFSVNIAFEGTLLYADTDQFGFTDAIIVSTYPYVRDESTTTYVRVLCERGKPSETITTVIQVRHPKDDIPALDAGYLRQELVN